MYGFMHVAVKCATTATPYLLIIYEAMPILSSDNIFIVDCSLQCIEYAHVYNLFYPTVYVHDVKDIYFLMYVSSFIA